MTNNPIYDASNTNVIYDIIPDITPLDKQIALHNHPRATVNNFRGDQQPPCVPPPRNCDAAAVSSCRFALPKIPSGGEKDEYVQMSSPLTPLSAVSPRYTQPPSLSISGDQPPQQNGTAVAGTPESRRPTREMTNIASKM